MPAVEERMSASRRVSPARLVGSAMNPPFLDRCRDVIASILEPKYGDRHANSASAQFRFAYVAAPSIRAEIQVTRRSAASRRDHRPASIHSPPTFTPRGPAMCERDSNDDILRGSELS